MDSSALRAGYKEFLAEARAGGFGTPPPGEWTAEQVLAHIGSNDLRIADVLDSVASGTLTRFDNLRVIDASHLDAYVARHGDADALIAAIEESSAQVCDSVDRLDSELAAVPVPAKIVDAGHTVVEGPTPLGQLLTMQAGFHLPAHAAQLRALRPDEAATA